MNPDWRKKMPKLGRFGKTPPPAHEVIPTRDRAGQPNGYVVPLVREAYMTVVLPGTTKGPHLHRRRAGMFCVVHGVAEFIIRDPKGTYSHVFLGEGVSKAPLDVPVDHACEIRCIGNVPAKIINMPTPAWSAEDPDENPVEGWNPDA